VPIGMNAGVSMIPCVVIKRPRRAFDSRSCETSSNVFCIRGEIPRNRMTKQIQTSKYSLRPAILPLYSRLTASGALSLLRGLKRVFLSPGVTTWPALYF
jgi:hypothetical protein